MKTTMKEFELQHPVACVFVVHGMEEYKDRYDGFAKYLNHNNIACITYDLPGHGPACAKEDFGWFGEKDGWKVLEESVYEVATYAKNKYPDIPIILFGHSMGAIIARTYLQEHEDTIDGVILSGAPNYVSASKFGIRLAGAISKVKGKKGKSKLLDGMTTGSFNKAITDPKTPIDWLCKNEEVTQAYLEDELCGFPFTIKAYQDLFIGLVKMQKKKKYPCQNPDLPILFLAGKEDPCIGGKKGFRGSIDLVESVGYQDVKYKVYDNMRHEILNEKDGKLVMDDVCVWIRHEFDCGK